MEFKVELNFYACDFSVDAVMICTPSMFHEEQVLQALKSGIYRNICFDCAF